jgi:hypothetical protein
MEQTTYSREQVQYNQTSCSICWREFTEGAPIAQLACKHIYDSACFSDSIIRCPTCRDPILGRSFTHLSAEEHERALNDFMTDLELLLPGLRMVPDDTKEQIKRQIISAQQEAIFSNLSVDLLRHRASLHILAGNDMEALDQLINTLAIPIIEFLETEGLNEENREEVIETLDALEFDGIDKRTLIDNLDGIVSMYAQGIVAMANVIGLVPQIITGDGSEPVEILNTEKLDRIINKMTKRLANDPRIKEFTGRLYDVYMEKKAADRAILISDTKELFATGSLRRKFSYIKALSDKQRKELKDALPEIRSFITTVERFKKAILFVPLAIYGIGMSVYFASNPD